MIKPDNIKTTVILLVFLVSFVFVYFNLPAGFIKNKTHTIDTINRDTDADLDYTYQKLSVKKTDTEYVFDSVVAHTEKARERGLGGVVNLKPYEAMLFAFDYDNLWSFWMKDMRFPIDIIWLDADKKVVDIVERVDPDTYPASFTPKKVSRYVLEVQAGTANKVGINVGDQFETRLK